MKINILLSVFWAALLLCSCGDNDEAVPSHMEKNWYVIEYDPNANELDRLIYEVYDRTGFPIFYNDTIGSQTRYDKGGNPYTYYEIFKPGYQFTSSNTNVLYYSLERDEERLQEMVELLSDYALTPYFAKENAPNTGKYGPLAFMLVDSLLNRKVADSLYLDLGVLVLSTRYTITRGVKKFVSVSDMTEEEKVKFGWNLAMYELKRYFENNMTEEFAAYYAITKETPDFYAKWNKRDLFEVAKVGQSYNYVNGPAYDEDFTTNPRKYGVLRYEKIYANSVYFPSQLLDLSDFVQMIYTKTDAEIRAEHGEFPMVMKRYEALLALLKTSGLTHFIKDSK